MEEIKLKNDAVFLAIAFGATQTVLSTLKDRIREIRLDSGPYWKCAEEISVEMESLIKSVRLQLLVKMSFSGDIDSKARALCLEFETRINELERLLTQEIRKEMYNEADRLRYQYVARFRPKRFLAKKWGVESTQRCDKIAADLERIRQQLAKMLPAGIVKITYDAQSQTG